MYLEMGEIFLAGAPYGWRLTFSTAIPPPSPDENEPISMALFFFSYFWFWIWFSYFASFFLSVCLLVARTVWVPAPIAGCPSCHIFWAALFFFCLFMHLVRSGICLHKQNITVGGISRSQKIISFNIANIHLYTHLYMYIVMLKCVHFLISVWFWSASSYIIFSFRIRRLLTCPLVNRADGFHF